MTTSYPAGHKKLKADVTLLYLDTDFPTGVSGILCYYNQINVGLFIEECLTGEQYYYTWILKPLQHCYKQKKNPEKF